MDNIEIPTNIPRYPGREIKDDYSKVVNKVITTYPNMSSDQQDQARALLRDLSKRIEGRELTDVLNSEILRFLNEVAQKTNAIGSNEQDMGNVELINSLMINEGTQKTNTISSNEQNLSEGDLGNSLKVLDNDFERINGLNGTNNPNGINLDSEYKRLALETHRIYKNGHNAVRENAYKLLIAEQLEWSHALKKPTLFSYELIGKGTNKIYASGWVTDIRGDKAEGPARGRLQYFLSYTKQNLNVLPSPDALFTEIPINAELDDTTGQTELRDVNELVNPFMEKYDSMTDPEQKRVVREFLRLINFRIKGQEQLKPVSDQIIKFLDLNENQINPNTNPSIQSNGNNPGGIDLNSQNMDLGVSKNGGGIQMHFDPAMLEAFRRSDFEGVVPNIISIQLLDLKSFLGLNN